MSAIEASEALMLFCFSIGWYWSIVRMLRIRQAAGKSLGFVLLVCFGYVFGLASKLMAWQGGEPLSDLVWLYGWNLLVVAFDLFLVVHFTRRAAIPVAA